MMGRSHLALNTAAAGAALAWASVLADPLSGPSSWLDQRLGDAVTWAWGVVGAEAPWWLASAPVSTPAGLVRDWVVPAHTDRSAALAAYAALSAGLLWLGSLLPDADSRSSMLGRRLPLAVPGPHRGLLHSDWFLLALFALSVPSGTRALVWLWLGAWLHCAVDGLSTAGRARFYPLGDHRTITFPDGEACVVVSGRRGGLYRSGQPAERAVLASMLALCSCALGAAALL